MPVLVYKSHANEIVVETSKYFIGNFFCAVSLCETKTSCCFSCFYFCLWAAKNSDTIF